MVKLKQQINNLTINTLTPFPCYWIVNSESCQEALSRYGFSSICLNGYDIQPLIQMLEGSSKASRYCYLIATDTTPQGLNNAYELRDYFRDNWDKHQLHSINYTLVILKREGMQSMGHMIEESEKNCS